MVLNARGILGVLVATAFVATGLWYGFGTFTTALEVTGRPSPIHVGDQPLETRTMTIECRSDGSAIYLTDPGQVMSFDGLSWQPQSSSPLCADARSSRIPLAIGLAVLGTVIGVVVAASGSRADGDD